MRWRAAADGLVQSLRAPGGPAHAGVRGLLGSDITFVGFDLGAAELLTGDGWFFVVQEQPTEPRFGFDELDGPGPPPAITSWSQATWEHTGTAPGAYLRIADNQLAGTALDGVRFVDHAAHLATLTDQQPMRIAIHAGGLPTWWSREPQKRRARGPHRRSGR